MPNVTLHFMAANDLNGTPLLTVTDEDDFLKAVELRVTLSELGGGSVRFARKVGFALFDSGAVQPEVFVRVLVHAWSDTEYFWGFFLDKREQKVIGEEGTEEFIFGGPGPKQYLDRAILTDEQFTGSGWNLDLENGVFRFSETATAGRVLNRIVQEARTNPIDAIPDLTLDFNDSNDSNNDPWTNDLSGTDDFELPIGQSLLQDLWELEDAAELETWIDLGTVSDRRFLLQAYPSIGTDYSGGAYAADVLRFVEASSLNPNGNIGSPEGGDSLWVKGQSLRKASHVLVRGKDGAYATAVRSSWSPGDYVKWAAIDYLRSSNPTILERAGTRWIRRQDNGEQQFDIPIIPGTDPTEGRYFPGPDELLWVGNTCSLFTGGVTGSALDYRNDDFRVTGIKLTSMREASDASDALKRAMSWEVVVQLNTERGGASSPSQGTTGASSGGGGCQCPRPCRPHTLNAPGVGDYLGAACSNVNTSILSDHPAWAGIQEERVEVAIAADVAAGDSIIAVTSWNQTKVKTRTVYDEQGNTWTKDADHENTASSLDDTVEIWRCNVTNPLSTGDYIRFAAQVTASPFGGRCLGVYSYDGTLTPATVGTGAGTISGSASITAPAGDVVVAALTFPGTATLTGDGDWDAMVPEVGVTGSSDNAKHLFAQQLISQAGTNAWTVAISPDRDWAAIGISYSVSGTEVTRGGHPDLVGTDTCYARGDHGHLVFREGVPTVDDDWEVAGYREGTLWLQVDDADSPTVVLSIWVLTDDATGAADWSEIELGVTDHGALSGLADDDHPQYLMAAELETAGHWEPVTNGSVATPEIVFHAGDVVMEWTA